MSRSHLKKKPGARARAAWKKSGAGAAKKFAGSPALQTVLTYSRHLDFPRAPAGARVHEVGAVAALARGRVPVVFRDYFPVARRVQGVDKTCIPEL